MCMTFELSWTDISLVHSLKVALLSEEHYRREGKNIIILHLGLLDTDNWGITRREQRDLIYLCDKGLS